MLKQWNTKVSAWALSNWKVAEGDTSIGRKLNSAAGAGSPTVVGRAVPRPTGEDDAAERKPGQGDDAFLLC